MYLPKNRNEIGGKENTMDPDLSSQVKQTARAHGGDLVGIVKVCDLPEYTENIARILPSARSIVVIITGHNLAALRSTNNQVAQFDTMHTYRECEQAAHRTSRFLASKGYPSVAVPAFIPIDMTDPARGMRGEICWRTAGVKAGLGSYGENGLLVTREFGSAIRASGLATSADLISDLPLEEDVCDHCMRCIEACPVGAISGGGIINKKLCGDTIFTYGLRFFMGLIRDLQQKTPNQAETLCKHQGLRELWQTFMTGNYYYCFQCQSQCMRPYSSDNSDLERKNHY
jgi:epoxyqueuosine reductase QueG